MERRQHLLCRPVRRSSTLPMGRRWASIACRRRWRISLALSCLSQCRRSLNPAGEFLKDFDGDKPFCCCVSMVPKRASSFLDETSIPTVCFKIFIDEASWLKNRISLNLPRASVTSVCYETLMEDNFWSMIWKAWADFVRVSLHGRFDFFPNFFSLFNLVYKIPKYA